MLDSYEHSQHAIWTIHKHGTMFSEIRVMIRSQYILLAILDAEILSRLLLPSGILSVTTPVRNHYLIQQVSKRLNQIKCVQVHEILVAPIHTGIPSIHDMVVSPIDTVLTFFHDVVLVYLAQATRCLCRYVPYSGRIFQLFPCTRRIVQSDTRKDN